MDKYLPAVAQMNDILHAVNVLIGLVITGIGTIIAAYLYQVKVSIPRRFEQQTAERQIQLEAMRKDFENKAAAQAVDIEREKMLPKLVESSIQMAQSINTTMLQSVQQTSTYVAQLTAHDRQLSANTDRLEENSEKLEAVEKKLSKLHDRFMLVFPRETYLQELFNELKTVVEETKKVCGEKRKGDSKEIPVITLPTPTDKGTILITGVMPEDLGNNAPDESLRPTG